MIEGYNAPDGINVHYTDENSYHKISEFLKKNVGGKCVILCIGTDRFIGDCLGPLTGTLLSKLNLSCPVVGTLENPVHAINLRKTISHIKANYRNFRILAVDACLGNEQSIGYIQVREGSIQPGRGVGKKLSLVGDFSIVGIVDEVSASESYKYENYFRINNVRLSLVMKMAETIAKGVYSAFQAQGNRY
ncbi:MAG: spore protease YyaC [Caulobacteraceae bacterium]